MNEYIDRFLHKFGLRGLVGLIVFAMLIWLFAHIAAEPGKSVSILWGLVEYTKPTDKSQKQVSRVEYAKPADNSQKQVSKNVDLSEEPEARKHDGTINASSEIIPVESSHRIFLNKSTTEILENISHLTDMQARNYVDQYYKGKWIRIRGPAEDILGNTEYGAVTFILDHGHLILDVKDEYLPRISHLTKGDTLTADGKIVKIGVHTNPPSVSILLDEGEIVEDD